VREELLATAAVPAALGSPPRRRQQHGRRHSALHLQGTYVHRV